MRGAESNQLGAVGHQNTVTNPWAGNHGYILGTDESLAMPFSFDRYMKRAAVWGLLKATYGLEQDLRHTAQARTFRLACLRATISSCEVAQSFLAVEKN